MRHAESAWPDSKGYIDQFNRKVLKMRLPVTGSLELTSRCNLKCVHCYLGSQVSAGRSLLPEMKTDRILTVLDEITEAGCLRFLITGGEPLSREDFPVIYRHAKTNGLLTTVFTNGTLMTEGLLDLFQDLPPQTVEISLYGATAETYETITAVKGSYKKCIRGIEQLLSRSVPVRLKTVLMSLNSHEFLEMEELAAGYGVRFRFDAAIFPRFSGDMAPLAFRIAPREAVEREFSDAGRLKSWKAHYQKAQRHIAPDTLYQCGAGVSSFHIGPHGSLVPCLMMSAPSYDLLQGSFTEGWDRISCSVGEKKAGADFACRTCEKRSLCGFCPAFFELENGSEHLRSAYLCALGENRYQSLISTED